MTGPVEQPVLVLTEHALEVRGRVEPVAWLVLEELVLRAVETADGVVAPASARSIAAGLGRSRDSVARALRHLSAADLVTRVDERAEQSGQFVGVHYRVDLRAAGLRLPAAPTAVAVVPEAVDTRHRHARPVERTTPIPADAQAPLWHAEAPTR